MAASSASSSSSAASMSTSSTSSSSSSSTPAIANGTSKDATSADYYFNSYSHFGIHEEMLKDRVRTLAYKRAIMDNAHLFKGKIVLDVGCGTGILCMFAARAGAKQVIGIECASIANQAKQIVQDNGLDQVITIIQGKVEEVTLPVPRVDIIISEWMGYFLLYESMLDTVLYARDKWLVPNGLLFPDYAELVLVAVEDEDYRQNKINFWDSVYGYDMSCVKNLVMMEPLVDTCTAKQIISSTATILKVNLNTVTKEELDFTSTFSLQLSRNDFCHGLCAYFNITFKATTQPINFSTGPRSEYTHWKSTIFYLDEPITVCKDELLKGTISVKRNAKNHRDLDIQLSTALTGKFVTHKVDKLYRLR